MACCAVRAASSHLDSSGMARSRLRPDRKGVDLVTPPFASSAGGIPGRGSPQVFSSISAGSSGRAATWVVSPENCSRNAASRERRARAARAARPQLAGRAAGPVEPSELAGDLDPAGTATECESWNTPRSGKTITISRSTRIPIDRAMLRVSPAVGAGGACDQSIVAMPGVPQQVGIRADAAGEGRPRPAREAALEELRASRTRRRSTPAETDAETRPNSANFLQLDDEERHGTGDVGDVAPADDKGHGSSEHVGNAIVGHPPGSDGPRPAAGGWQPLAVGLGAMYLPTRQPTSQMRWQRPARLAASGRFFIGHFPAPVRESGGTADAAATPVAQDRLLATGNFHENINGTKNGRWSRSQQEAYAERAPCAAGAGCRGGIRRWNRQTAGGARRPRRPARRRAGARRDRPSGESTRRALRVEDCRGGGARARGGGAPGGSGGAVGVTGAVREGRHAGGGGGSEVDGRRRANRVTPLSSRGGREPGDPRRAGWDAHDIPDAPSGP